MATPIATGWRHCIPSRTATPTSAPTSSAAPFAAARRRILRPARHQHHRPRRHPSDRPAISVYPRRHDHDATRRYKWPGLAAVIVSVVHLYKAKLRRTQAAGWQAGPDPHRLSVPRRQPRRSPGAERQRRQELSRQHRLGHGLYLRRHRQRWRGQPPMADMHRLIQQDPRNQQRIFPYLGGES